MRSALRRETAISQPFTLTNLLLSLAAVSACMLVTLDVLPVNGSSVPMARAVQPSTGVSTREGNRARCAECGVVESIVEIGGRHRMTIRFRDGTTATSDELTPRSWRAGQRVIVVRAADSGEH